MIIVSVIGFALIAAVLATILRQYRPEFGMVLTVLAGAGILVMVITALMPALQMVKDLGSDAKIDSKYISILLKALGICYITQLASDACKDANESALSSKIELAGKAAIVILSLPLFNQILEVVKKLISAE